MLLMKYSGKGQLLTNEKKQRKDIYNGLGGHVEKGEDVISSAVRETKEEAGVDLLNPKIKGVMNVSGFFGKDVTLFIVAGSTKDEPLSSTLEGELEWVCRAEIENLNIFQDVKPFLEKILEMKENQMFVGSSLFDGKDKLINLEVNIV